MSCDSGSSELRKNDGEIDAFKIDLTMSDRLREHIHSRLRQHPLQTIPITDKHHAAVALTVLDRREQVNLGDIPFHPHEASQAGLILTIRAARLKNHGGQRAFPGGRVDRNETAEQAALRELEEEVGLRLNPEQVLGRLDDYETRSGFVITPVVVWGGNVGELRANPAEVESIHRIPCSELLRSDAPILQYKRRSEHPVLKMPLGNDWIAAPTAALAYQFREVALLGKATRVAHFEQPRFAWA